MSTELDLGRHCKLCFSTRLQWNLMPSISIYLSVSESFTDCANRLISDSTDSNGLERSFTVWAPSCSSFPRRSEMPVCLTTLMNDLQAFSLNEHSWTSRITTSPETVRLLLSWAEELKIRKLFYIMIASAWNWLKPVAPLLRSWKGFIIIIMEQEICPNCEKVVFDAEGFPAGKVIT